MKCPICNEELKVKVKNGWNCKCGEFVPFGTELKESCGCSPFNKCGGEK